MRTLEEDRTPEQDMNEQDDMSEQDSPDPEPAAPPPLPPPPPPPQSRIHSTHAQKGDDLQKLMDDTNKRVAALPVMPRAAAHAPAPLFHQAEPAAQQPEPAAVQTGASKPRQRKPVKPRTKQPAKRRDSDESTSDDSSAEDASSDSEDEPEYEALEIVAHRTYRRRIQYLVKWANGPKGESYEPSWEPKENVGLPLIEEYDAKLSSQPPEPAAGAPAKRKRSDEPAVNPAVNLAASTASIATAKQKRACSIAPACVPDAPPLLPLPPPPPPARVAMTLNRQGVDPSVRYGTITGLLENTVYEELQVKASMVDDYGNGVFVKNDEEVYIIGDARCESSSKTFYRVSSLSTWDGCVGFILSQFVELEA